MFSEAVPEGSRMVILFRRPDCVGQCKDSLGSEGDEAAFAGPFDEENGDTLTGP